MSTLVKSLTYRGDVTAVIGLGESLAFTTTHSEGHATALYRVDADKLNMTVIPLPQGGTALAPDIDHVWLGGSDGHIYLCPPKGSPKAVGAKCEGRIAGIVLVAGQRLAFVAGKQLFLRSKKEGHELQALPLPDEATCLAVDGTGHWLVVGMLNGTIAVFESEKQDDFAPAESAKLHEGRVTALSFEPEELRFLSAGSDNKLLSTYARGKLEPEDRGRGANHTEPIVAVVRTGQRFYTGSKDASVKAWPKGVATRPFTHKDGVAKVASLALVEIGRKPHLVVGCEDNSFRIFELDDEGKPGEMTRRINDAVALARYELSQPEAARREAMLKMLHGFGDWAGLELVAQQMTNDNDHQLRLLAVNLLGQTTHPRVPPVLEKALTHTDEVVRVSAFESLRRIHGEGSLRPIELALKANKADVGIRAVQALESLAPKDDQALAKLVETLNANAFDVRREALFVLEQVKDATSPEADLIAAGSTQADIRKLALVRLFQRDLLGDSQVQSALRRRCEDADAAVRLRAYLLTVLSRPALAKTLRRIDPEMERLLSDLEAIAPDGSVPPPDDKKPTDEKKPLEAPPEVAGQMQTIADNRKKVTLAPTDYEPLLQATASRSLDTCLQGARGLAVLGDPRAFGLLLQLSREDDKNARAHVCRAMAALDDPRAVNRLRSLLFDSEASVRDAAFTALVQIHQADPLLGAEAGLGVPAEDVRRRALQSLVAALRQTPPKKANAPGIALMRQALNDAAASVRGEAFKAVLNMKLGGDDAGTIRFAGQSVHADIRREALTEVMAQINQDWAWPILLDFFNDPDSKLRDEAFEFAAKKNKELELLQTALKSKYVDIRRKAVEGLIKKRIPAAQKLLVNALGDPEKEVRRFALSALIDAEARDELVNALAAPHDDIRVWTARALAAQGDSAALPVLRELATRPKPEQKERESDWAGLVAEALLGLHQLGDEAALRDVLPLLESTVADIQANAAWALVGMARPSLLEQLRPLLQHQAAAVKYRVALAMALAGDAQAAPLVFAADAKLITENARLAASFGLGDAGEDRLIAFLDHSDDHLRHSAQLLLMLAELTEPDAEPQRCLPCLASKNARSRLTAARAIESFADTTAFESFVVNLFNDRGDAPAWKIPAEIVRDVALLLATGGAQTKYRTVLLLAHLAEKEQATWDEAWGVHRKRFAQELQTLRQQRKPTAVAVDPQHMRQLAFGAYVGLVREQGGSSTTPAIVRVRQTAMTRLVQMTEIDKTYADAAKPVLIQALGDPNQPVRFQAFEQLQTLGLDRTALGAEALAVGHTDLGVKGLELLSDGTSKKEGDKVLEEAMLIRTDALALEAAKLLIARKNKTAVAEKGLTAAYEAMRRESVQWLAAEYANEPLAQKALRLAVTSRYPHVREAATLELATKKDPQAFEALVKLLGENDKNTQQKARTALLTLGDPRTPTALLDRIDNDPGKTAITNDLLKGAASFRKTEIVDRLVAYAERTESWNPVYDALFVISGFDQAVLDHPDENPNKQWEQEQHPRHDAVLAKLLERILRNGHTNRLAANIFDGARWSRGNAVDGPLAQIANLADDGLRTTALTIMGWRLRKRNSSAEPLVKALRHKDPNTQFIAAEGLAKAKRAEGINILLAALEYLEDVHMRRRAVLALGELADARSVDVLLKLASEEGHALQEAAAEAIGHLGQSKEAAEAFKLLAQYARHTDALAVAAMRGLRWLNTRDGWELLRQRATDTQWSGRDAAVAHLGYDTDPATRNTLERIALDAAKNNRHVMVTALQALRRLSGEASLEPDYLALRTGHRPNEVHLVAAGLKRVLEQGTPERILTVFAHCHDDVQTQLTLALLKRPQLSAEQMLAALTQEDAATVRLAARLLGRLTEFPKSALVALETAVTQWQQQWLVRRTDPQRTPTQMASSLTPVADCLGILLWCASRAKLKPAIFQKLIEARPDDRLYQPIRRAAVQALVANPVPDALVPLLNALATGTDATLRTLAIESLARQHTKHASSLAEKALADRPSFNRLVAAQVNLDPTLKKAAGDLHYQGVALPHLIARKDFEALLSVATNDKLPEATRLGAVEGLAALATEAAEAKLLVLAQDDDEAEEIRKAAWKSLRRSRRARTAPTH